MDPIELSMSFGKFNIELHPETLQIVIEGDHFPVFTRTVINDWTQQDLQNLINSLVTFKDRINARNKNSTSS